MGTKTEIEHRADIFICYEFAPVSWNETVLPFLPDSEVWNNDNMISSPDHGISHAAECILWGQILLPILKERGINDLDERADLLALGHHDIGRNQEDDDIKHPFRAVQKLVTGREKHQQFTQIPAESFNTALFLCRFHSKEPAKKDSNNMRLIHFIDILTMFGRYHKTDWLKNIDVDYLLKATPLVKSKPAFSKNEVLSFIEAERSLHTIAQQIHDNQDFFQAVKQAAFKLGLLTP